MEITSGAGVAVSAERAAADFAAEIAYWREVRGMSKRQLAQRMRFDPSYVSHVESGRHRPSEEFARLADEALNAGEAIRRRYDAYADSGVRNGHGTGSRGPADARSCLPGNELLVEHDEAHLVYDGNRYLLDMRRRVRNTGVDPVTRYLIRISVDRYPDDPERSNAHYRVHPLTWGELDLRADCRGESMSWCPKSDRDAFKEVWLRFENDDVRFPLYPGEETWISYRYTVGDNKWGHWFQRAVRLPTEHLSVMLDFPAALDPVVWGTETSMTREAVPLRTALARTERDGTRSFSWSTRTPPLHTRYRLEWRFKARHGSKGDTAT